LPEKENVCGKIIVSSKQRKRFIFAFFYYKPFYENENQNHKTIFVIAGNFTVIRFVPIGQKLRRHETPQ